MKDWYESGIFDEIVKKSNDLYAQTHRGHVSYEAFSPELHRFLIQRKWEDRKCRRAYRNLQEIIK